MNENNNINKQIGEQFTTNDALVTATQSVPTSYQPAYGDLGGYRGGGVDGSQGELVIDIREYWRIIVKNKWLVLGFIAAFVSIGMAYTLMQTPLYTSTVRLQIDRNAAQAIKGGDVLDREGTSGRNFLKTQYKRIESRMMAERVSAVVGLANNKAFFDAQGRSIVGIVVSTAKSILGERKTKSSSRKRSNSISAVKILLQNRQVVPVLGSRLVDINYTDASPDRAQKIAAAFAGAFIESNIDKRFQASATAKKFLADKIGQLKLRLRKSERALLDFAKREQIVAVTGKSSIAERNLAAANVELGRLTTERIKKEQLWKQAQVKGVVNLTQLTNEAVNQLRAKRDELATEYREKLEIFKSDYPSMIEIKNKLKEIDQQISRVVQSIKDELKADYESAAAQVKEMRAQIVTLKGIALDLKQRSIQYNIFKREVDTNRDLYNSLLQRYKEVDVAAGASTNNIFTVDRATFPESPSSPQLLQSLLLFFALGIGGGIAMVFLIEHLDDTIHTAEELHTLSGLTTLGIIPRIKDNSSIDQEFADPRSPLSEAYRSLATSLQLATESGLPKTLSLTSAGPGEAKSTTAIALAQHFATMGMKVLLIDGDLRKASLHQKMGLQNVVGLSNYLTGSCQPQEAMQATQTSNMAFMSSGPLPPNAADLLAGNKLFSLLSTALEVFDFIIVDGPPMLGLADAQLISNATSATIFVTSSGQSRVGQIKGALHRLRMVNAPVIGSVLAKYDAKAAGYGGYGGYGTYGGDEYFSYGHTTEPAIEPAVPEQQQAQNTTSLQVER